MLEKKKKAINLDSHSDNMIPGHLSVEIIFQHKTVVEDLFIPFYMWSANFGLTLMGHL